MHKGTSLLSLSLPQEVPTAAISKHYQEIHIITARGSPTMLPQPAEEKPWVHSGRTSMHVYVMQHVQRFSTVRNVYRGH